MLLQSKVIVNAEDNSGQTALTIATSKNLLNIVNVLLKHGANVDQQIKGNFRNTSMHIAVNNANISIIKLLLTAKPNLLITNSYGRNVLDEASLKTSTDIYKVIVEDHSKRNESIKDDNKPKKEVSYDHSPSTQILQNMSVLNKSSESNVKAKQTHKISDLIQINSINQQHQITERDLKYAKIKLLSESNKIEFSQIIRPKIDNSQNNIIKKLKVK